MAVSETVLSWHNSHCPCKTLFPKHHHMAKEYTKGEFQWFSSTFFSRSSSTQSSWTHVTGARTGVDSCYKCAYRCGLTLQVHVQVWTRVAGARIGVDSCYRCVYRCGLMLQVHVQVWTHVTGVCTGTDSCYRYVQVLYLFWTGYTSGSP